MLKKIHTILNNMNLQKVRFTVQLLSFVLFVYGGYFAIDFGSKLPIFACPYNKEAVGACYLIPLQHQLSMPAQVLLGGAGIGVIVGFLGFLFWFIFLNKAWCGYVCPFGTFQDWLTMLRKKMRVRFSIYTQNQFEDLSKIKYLFLIIVLFIPLLMGIGVLGSEWSASFCQMCPARVVSPMFSGDFSQWIIDFSSITAMILTALGMIFAGLFLLGSFVKKRFFCFFCPMSALHFIFSNLSMVQLKKDGSKCTKCGDCYAVCDMQIKDIADDVTSINILRDDCIMCLKCIAACPEEDALHFDIFKFRAFNSTKEGFEKRMNIEKPKQAEVKFSQKGHSDD